jgi:hypothetical protein
MIWLNFSVARSPAAFRAALAQRHRSIASGSAMPRTTLPSLTSAGCCSGPAISQGTRAFVAKCTRGAGVAELIDHVLATDLTEFDATAERGRVVLVADERGKPLLYRSKKGGSCNCCRG